MYTGPNVMRVAVIHNDYAHHQLAIYRSRSVGNIDLEAVYRWCFHTQGRCLRALGLLSCDRNKQFAFRRSCFTDLAGPYIIVVVCTTDHLPYTDRWTTDQAATAHTSHDDLTVAGTGDFMVARRDGRTELVSFRRLRTRRAVVRVVTAVKRMKIPKTRPGHYWKRPYRLSRHLHWGLCVRPMRACCRRACRRSFVRRRRRSLAVASSAICC